MKCPKCGTETNSKFCPECGTPITQQQNFSYSGPAYDYIPNEIQEPIQIKKHTGLGIASFILSFLGPLALIGIILAFIDLAKDSTKSNKHTLPISALIIGFLVLAGVWASITDSNTKLEETTVVESEMTDETSNETTSDDEIIVDDNSETKEEPKIESIEPKLSKDEFIASCADLEENYKLIARNPSDYTNQNFHFTCYVSSVREGGLFTGYQKYYTSYAFDLDKARDYIKKGWSDDLDDASVYGMDYDISVWLLDNRNSSADDYLKILEDDIIKVYGTFTGMTETKNVLNGERGEQMSLDIKYVELIEE